MSDPQSAYDDALNVLQHLRAAGFEAYFAGGCVRDFLLGQPAKDYDVATNAAPNQVRKLFKNTQAVGAAFGVILVRHEHSTIEVATFRTDLEYRDGRRPEGVKFATAQEDAQRRDFTINGLFRDPIENRIIDYVGGQADLQAKVIRAIGNADERFAEDHLRLLRAVRFASRLNFEIEPTTAAAISAHAHELIRISPERIAEELRKMLMPTSRNRAYLLLQQFGIIRILLRFLPEKPGPNQPLKLFQTIAKSRPITFGLALAALVLEFRINASGDANVRRLLAPAEMKRTANSMRQALKISNDESDEIIGALSFHQLLSDAPPSVATLKRFLQQRQADDATTLMTGIEQCGLLSERINPVLASLEELRKTDYAPPPLITGDDLTAAGAVPGPKFKLALDAAYDAQLEGQIHSREEAMELARRRLNPQAGDENAPS
jgi:tRNA nucleotidyltransferase/poly(A) polymerase